MVGLLVAPLAPQRDAERVALTAVMLDNNLARNLDCLWAAKRAVLKAVLLAAV